MNPEQEKHVEDISKEFYIAMAIKYEAGAKEHGGNLWDMDEDRLLECAIEEAIDQVVYLLTLRKKHRETR